MRRHSNQNTLSEYAYTLVSLSRRVTNIAHFSVLAQCVLLRHAILPMLLFTDMSWLECEAHAEMYERAGFLTSHDGGVSILAGATLGGGEPLGVV